MATLKFAKDVTLKLKYQKDISNYNNNYYEILSEFDPDYGYDFGDHKVFILEEAEDDDDYVRLHLCIDTGKKYPESIFSWCVDNDHAVMNAN